VRRYFALLTAALLSGCGLTDGPNRTGSAWLDDLDLGPQGLESVTVPFRALQVQVMADPSVPAYNGTGTLSVGQSDGFTAVTSLWFDPQDTSRWVRKRPADTARGSWTLVMRLDTALAARDSTVELQVWHTVRDTLSFLLGKSSSSTSPSLVATIGDSTVRASLGDSNFVRYGQPGDIGFRIQAPKTPSRGVYAVYLVDGKGDTLLPGLVDGRAGWGVRWRTTTALALGHTIGAGKRVRLLADANTLRSHIVTSLHLPQVANDSFDNTVAVFSARAKSSIGSASPGGAYRFRLASWVVQQRDTTVVEIGDGDRQAAFRSSRTSDGATMTGTLHVQRLDDSIARVFILHGTDTVPFYNRAGSVQNHFYLFKGDSIEAPMYQDPGWTKFSFRNQDGKIRFIRTILGDGVIADDQIQSYDESGNPVYRDESVAKSGSVRFEARAAFGRILNRKAQEVWTDLYPAAVSTTSSLDDNFGVNLLSTPIDSVTFLVRRRSQGVVQ